MLLNSHHLNAVIAIFLHTRQDIFRELLVGPNFLGILTHTHMALINQQRSLVGLERFLFPLVLLLRVPHLSGEYLRVVVLYHTTAPGRNTLSFSPIPLHLHLVELSMLQCLFAEFQLPVASACNTLATIFLRLLPVVEVTNQIDVRRIGSPLTEHPALGKFMQTEIQMA